MGVNKLYTYFKRSPMYIALEDVDDCDFLWFEDEIAEFEMLWNQDLPIADMAAKFERSEISILIMSFDRLLNGAIKPRQGWTIW